MTVIRWVLEMAHQVWAALAEPGHICCTCADDGYRCCYDDEHD